MAVRATALEESPRDRHVISRVWPQVKEKTGMTQQVVFDRYREVCAEFGIPPAKQIGTIGHWLRGEFQPDFEQGVALIKVFNEALKEIGEDVIDPLQIEGGSPGNRTLNLRVGSPLHLKSV